MRAWTVFGGATAPNAAGVIHTDFERGFIKAEVVSYADYKALTTRYARCSHVVDETPVPTCSH